MMRYLPIAVFIALAVLLFVGLGLDPKQVPSPLIDKPAPPFNLPELRDPTQRVDNKALLGTPYLLNVWGSWCPACRDEHPVVVEFARRHHLTVIGLNWKDDPATAMQWLQRFGDPYSAIAVDADGRTAIDYGVYGAPETFLIDAQGIIRYKKIGPLTPDDFEREVLPRIGVKS
ncbi:DsbE family thiol:disulfide interchange protein [Ahniella affigens]|uniref:DsbE family thiol:disulfide interchange protein n=1 Tax=Ahniella affigens TaxID=2021234 RepID=A0A2P1PQG6_9GAMM|nr:DsbE family thiol:disulfide interchange protein [Ahniella affigens]AVP97072.1 DsbE family thiol:disulfide interchange protein [Ahniella affigens]